MVPDESLDSEHPASVLLFLNTIDKNPAESCSKPPLWLIQCSFSSQPSLAGFLPLHMPSFHPLTLLFLRHCCSSWVPAPVDEFKLQSFFFSPVSMLPCSIMIPNFQVNPRPMLVTPALQRTYVTVLVKPKPLPTAGECFFLSLSF